MHIHFVISNFNCVVICFRKNLCIHLEISLLLIGGTLRKTFAKNIITSIVVLLVRSSSVIGTYKSLTAHNDGCHLDYCLHFAPHITSYMHSPCFLAVGLYHWLSRTKPLTSCVPRWRSKWTINREIFCDRVVRAQSLYELFCFREDDIPLSQYSISS